MQQPTSSSADTSPVKKEEEAEEKQQELEAKQELPLSSSTAAINPEVDDQEMLELKREPEEAPSVESVDASSRIDADAVKEGHEQLVPEVKREPEEAATATTSLGTGAVKEEEDGADDAIQQEELQTLGMKQVAESKLPVTSTIMSLSVQNEEEVQVIEVAADAEQQLEQAQEELQLPEASTAQQQDLQPNEEPSDVQQESEMPPLSSAASTALSREALAAELQCVLCHDVFVKVRGSVAIPPYLFQDDEPNCLCYLTASDHNMRPFLLVSAAVAAF